jgi:hypothetical protein
MPTPVTTDKIDANIHDANLYDSLNIAHHNHVSFVGEEPAARISTWNCWQAVINSLCLGTFNNLGRREGMR